MSTAPLLLDAGALCELVSNRSMSRLETLGGQDGLASSLGTRTESGLPLLEVSDEGTQARTAAYGSNKLPRPRSASFFTFLWPAASDKMLRVLSGIALVSLLAALLFPNFREGEAKWIEGTSILVTVALVVLIDATNRYHQERQFARLDAIKMDFEVTVRRGGQDVSLACSKVLVGDLLMLETGSQVPADAILVRGYGLQVDEASMTGESEPVNKSPERDPFILSGCQIIAGMGSAIVVAVGARSEYGAMMEAIGQMPPPPPTELQRRLGRLAAILRNIGVSVALLALVIQVVLWGIRISHRPWDSASLLDLIEYLLLALALLVVAVPEGLPLAVTICLAYGVRCMIKHNTLVRRTNAVEAMGTVTAICSDKTGTLTQNKMTVVSGTIGQSPFDLDRCGWAMAQHEALELVAEAIALNSTASIDLASGTVVGNRTEAALLEYVHLFDRVGFLCRRREARIEARLPFSSANKYMATMVQSEGVPLRRTERNATAAAALESSGGDGDPRLPTEAIESQATNGSAKPRAPYRRLYVKGAPEVLLPKCSRLLSSRGGDLEDLRLDDRAQANIDELLTRYGEACYRVIAIAYMDDMERTPSEMADGGPSHAIAEIFDGNSAPLTLIALCAITDPLRVDASASVDQCQRGSITVRMLTGDSVEIAAAISRQCHILRKPDEVLLDGPAFRALSDDELDAVLPRLRVLARAQPLDKLRMVKRLQAQGEIVAVTGDGINDAPAIKIADVGLAMGIIGTEVARSASDIVLMDDNFASIVHAIAWGRTIFENLQSFVQFQITINVVAIGIVFVSINAQIEQPLRPMQFLWINLIMDTLAALGLATTQPAHAAQLHRPPIPRDSPIISRVMWLHICCQAIVEAAIVLLALIWVPSVLHVASGFHIRHPTVHYTVIFNTFVFLQVFNLLNARAIGIDGAFAPFSRACKLDLFWGVFAFIAVVQVIIVEGVGAWMHCAPLTLEQWLFSIVLGSIVIPTGILARTAIRLFHRTQRGKRWLKVPRECATDRS